MLAPTPNAQGAWVPKSEVPNAKPAPRPSHSHKRTSDNAAPSGDGAATASGGAHPHKRPKLEATGAVAAADADAGMMVEEEPAVACGTQQRRGSGGVGGAGDSMHSELPHRHQQQEPSEAAAAALAAALPQQQQQRRRSAGGMGSDHPMEVDAAGSADDDVVSRDQQMPDPSAASQQLPRPGQQQQAAAAPRREQQAQSPWEERPQAPQLLTPSDFGPGLEGQRLLVLWPDDGRWDAGDVRAVDVESGRATIIYTEGEGPGLLMFEAPDAGTSDLCTAVMPSFALPLCLPFPLCAQQTSCPPHHTFLLPAHELEELDLRTAIAAGEVAWLPRPGSRSASAHRRSRQPLNPRDLAALQASGSTLQQAAGDPKPGRRRNRASGDDGDDGGVKKERDDEGDDEEGKEGAQLPSRKSGGQGQGQHDKEAVELLMSLAELAPAPAAGGKRSSAAGGGDAHKSSAARQASAGGARGGGAAGAGTATRSGGGGGAGGAGVGAGAALGPAAQKRLAAMAQQYRCVWGNRMSCRFPGAHHHLIILSSYHHPQQQ